LDKPPTTILLLGSFDSQTKSLLKNLKQEIAKTFSGENTYALMIDAVELYRARDIEVLTELFDKGRITLLIFQDDQLIDMDDVELRKEGAETTVYNYLKDRYGIVEFSRLPIFNKLDVLMRTAKVIFLLRDKEETRGGEYLELMHALFREHAQKIWFLKKNSIMLSEMLMEYLDKYGVKMRTYQEKRDLTAAVIRTLKYQLRDSDAAQ
jgi:hypothetical protein